jgi:hypothetical protein
MLNVVEVRQVDSELCFIYPQFSFDRQSVEDPDASPGTSCRTLATKSPRIDFSQVPQDDNGQIA